MGIPSVGLRNVGAISKKRPLLLNSPPAKRLEVPFPPDSLDDVPPPKRDIIQRRTVSPQVEDLLPTPPRPERTPAPGPARTLAPAFAAAAAAPPVGSPAPRPVGGATGSPFRIPSLFPAGSGTFVGHEQRRQRDASQAAVVAPFAHHKRGGYRNLGNTCYMGAMLSALAALHPFVNDLLDPRFVAQMDGLACPTLTALVAIVRQSLRGTHEAISPAALKEAVAVHKDNFATFQQQDAHEFFLALLDQTHEEVMATLPKALAAAALTPHTTPSPVQRNFEGSITHEFTCKACGHKAEGVEVFYALSLTLPKFSVENLRVQDLLDYYFSPSSQEARCEGCGHTQSLVRHRLRSLPRLLVLHIQRSEAQFSTDGAFVGHLKRTDPCTVSFALDVDPLCAADVLYPPPEARRSAPVAPNLPTRPADTTGVYSLRAMTLHLGEEADGGHYKTVVEQTAGQWLEYDDERVAPLPRVAVAAAGRQSAYLLFYTFGNTRSH
jgi:ubiquitin C-terminal hydrolase